MNVLITDMLDKPNIAPIFRGRAIMAWTLITLLFGLLITAWLLHSAQLETDQKVQIYFDYRVRNALSLIDGRVGAYQQVLRGMSGLFEASKSVERDEFRAYVNKQLLSENYPGIQGLGFSIIVPPVQKNSHIASVRAEGFANYSLRPEGQRDLYTPIVYIEPFSDRNLRAFGYDMFSEPIRHAAMQKALDSEIPTLSHRVTLVQEVGKDIQAGFLTQIIH